MTYAVGDRVRVAPKSVGTIFAILHERPECYGVEFGDGSRGGYFLPSLGPFFEPDPNLPAPSDALSARPGPYTKQAARLIYAAMEERGMTQAELARRADLSAKHVNLVLNRKAGADEKTIETLARIVGLRLRIVVDG